MEQETKKSIHSKMILVYYINVDGILSTDIETYIADVKKNITLGEKYDDLVELFVPIKGQPTKIERIP